MYLVELQGPGFTMKQWDGNSWVTTGKTVVNTLQAVEVNIEKIVAGSFGILSRDFDFTVQSDRPIKQGSGYTLSEDGKTASFPLGHKEDITLTLEPGSVITISETNAQGYSMSLTSGGVPVSGNQYTVPSDGTKKTVSLQVTNTKNATVDTGIVLDSLPISCDSGAGCGRRRPACEQAQAPGRLKGWCLVMSQNPVKTASKRGGRGGPSPLPAPMNFISTMPSRP
ncbi:MAG: hypothetical protein V8T45_04850 [Oscillospiraceae bacterium]